MNVESSRPRPELGGLLWIDWQGSVHQVILDGVHPAWLGHYMGNSSPSMFTKGSGRCSTVINLSRSSCGVVASFAKASARVFSALGTCLT